MAPMPMAPPSVVRRLTNWLSLCRRRAPSAVVPVLLAGLVSGCLAPHYSIDEQRGAQGGAVAGGASNGGVSVAGDVAYGGTPFVGPGGANGGGSTSLGTGGTSPVILRYCDTLPAGDADASPVADWSCVTATKNNSTDTSGVVLSGTFLPMSGNTTFDSLEYCRLSLTTCDDTRSPLPDFNFTSTQQGCAIVNWHEGTTAYSATMWQTITQASSIFIGTIPLVNPTVVHALASALLIPIHSDGAALIGIKDCSGNAAAGVKFLAQTTPDGPAIGLHFSIQGEFSIPELTPTGASGFGGLANLPAGASNIYAYVGDGCIVAEARIVSEPSRIAYVYLVPNGYR